MLGLILWLIIIAGIFMILISFLTFKRKDELELSSNVSETVLFRAGAITLVIGVILKIAITLLTSR